MLTSQEHPSYTPQHNPAFQPWACIPAPLPAPLLFISLLSLVPQRRFPSAPLSTALCHIPLGNFSSLPSRNQCCTGVLIPSSTRLLMEVVESSPLEALKNVRMWQLGWTLSFYRTFPTPVILCSMIPASAGLVGVNRGEQSLAGPFPGRGEDGGAGDRGQPRRWHAGIPSATLTLAAVTGSQQRLLVLAVVCKGRSSAQTPPGSISCC